jgi:hypothetical protein
LLLQAGYDPDAGMFTKLLRVLSLLSDKQSLELQQELAAWKSVTAASSVANAKEQATTLRHAKLKKHHVHLQSFEVIFRGLTIDVTDTCPECSRVLNDGEIREGWTSQPNDYTTACSMCGERFIPRFKLYDVNYDHESDLQRRKVCACNKRIPF